MRTLAVATLLALVACSNTSKREDATPPVAAAPPAATPAAPDAPASKVYLGTPQGDAAVTVEVVATEAKIERGLMYRENLPPDQGMLFLMGKEKAWTFWMRNTLIPLDMIFIKGDMTVAGVVANAEPMTDTLRQVPVPSLYVLEVNGGWAASHHVVAGAKVRFEHVPAR